MQKVVDADDVTRDVHVSVQRDGTVWVRLGDDDKTTEWKYASERRRSVQSTILSLLHVSLLSSLNYTDVCVLTDLQLDITDTTVRRADVTSFNSVNLVIRSFSKGLSHVIRMQRLRTQSNCQWKAVNVSLTADKQSVQICSIGKRRASDKCFQPLPSIKSPSTANVVQSSFWKHGLFNRPVTLLQHISIDNRGYTGDISCDSSGHHVTRASSLVFSLIGSYYHVYLQVASCPPALGN